MTDNADAKERKRLEHALRERERRAKRKASATATAERESELPIDTNGTAVYDKGMSNVTAQATESDIVALLSRHEDGFHNPMEDGFDEKCSYCRDEKKAREEWEARQAEAGPDGVDFAPEDRPAPEPTEPAVDEKGYLIIDEGESEDELLALASASTETMSIADKTPADLVGCELLDDAPKSVADIVTYMHRNDPPATARPWYLGAYAARTAGMPQNAPTTPETPRKVRTATPVVGATAALPLGHTWVLWEQPSMKAAGRCLKCGKIEKSHLPK